MTSTSPDVVTAQERGALPASLSLKRNFSWTFTGNIVNVLSQFGMLLVLAHLGNAEMVGQYGLGLAISAPVFMLANMSLRNVQVTDVNDEFLLAEYAALRVVSGCIGLLALVVIVSILGYTRETAWVVMLLGLSKAIEGMSDIVFGVFQKHEQMDKIAKSMIIKASITLAVFASLLWATESLIVGLLGILAVWSARFLAYDVRNLLRMDGDATGADELVTSVGAAARHHRRLVALAMLSLPAGLSSSLISLNANIPRYAIEWSSGTAELGLFTVLAYPIVAGNAIVSALAQSSLPRLSRYYAAHDRPRFVRLLARLLVLAVGLALLGVVLAATIGGPTLRVMFGDEYAAKHGVFVVLILGMGIGFINWFLNSSLHAMRAFRTMLGVQIVTSVAVVLLAVLLVTEYGIEGAAFAVVASLVFQVAVKATVVLIRLNALVDTALDSNTKASL